MSGDAATEKSSLFGLVSFRPRLTVVLIFLTLTVAVVGYHISRGTGAGRMEEISRQALRVFAAAKAGMGNAATQDPAGIEEKIREWTGASVALPRDERQFAYKGATREKLGKRKAAAVLLTFADEPYLLVIMRPDPIRGGDAPAAMFSEDSFLSWEKDGNSFVFWERDAVQYFLVSGVDLTRTFDLVRQYFT